MDLLNFIKNHQDWKGLLQKDPYFLEIKEDEGYTLLKYNQIKSDFSQPIVQECRGIILDSNNKIVCWPFDKFFNFGEPNAAEIDWSSARVQEKLDGSILKLWYDGCWRLSTNGTIDAYKTELNMNELLKVNCSFTTFGQLFEAAKNYKDIDLNALNPNYTYMFELVSPYNKVVISYPEIILNHIGTRNNITGEELNVDIGIRKPKEYPIHSLEDCVRCASELTADEEGYVVVDKYWRRIKVKNPVYLQLHRMVSNNQLKIKDILHMLFENEQEEFLTYFPEYRIAFEEVKASLDHMKERLLQNRIQLFHFTTYVTRKDFALEVMNLDKENSDFYFKSYDRMDYSFQDWVENMPVDKLVEKIEMDANKNNGK